MNAIGDLLVLNDLFRFRRCSKACMAAVAQLLKHKRSLVWFEDNAADDGVFVSLSVAVKIADHFPGIRELVLSDILLSLASFEMLVQCLRTRLESLTLDHCYSPSQADTSMAFVVLASECRGLKRLGFHTTNVHCNRSWRRLLIHCTELEHLAVTGIGVCGLARVIGERQPKLITLCLEFNALENERNALEIERLPTGENALRDFALGEFLSHHLPPTVQRLELRRMGMRNLALEHLTPDALVQRCANLRSLLLLPLNWAPHGTLSTEPAFGRRHLALFLQCPVLEILYLGVAWCEADVLTTETLQQAFRQARSKALQVMHVGTQTYPAHLTAQTQRYNSGTVIWHVCPERAATTVYAGRRLKRE